MAVQTWRAPLDVDAETLARLTEPLSASERALAAARRGDADRCRYLADHGWRRLLLARLAGGTPADVTYAVGEHGKPELAAGGPRFSASRSGDIAVYATSWTSAVGVDVEQIDPEGQLPALVARVFSAAERQALERVPAAQRPAAATACWTRKEAYGKALGTGMVFPLSALEVWAGDDRPVRIGEWSIHAVDVGPEARAAVAVRADGADSGVIDPTPRPLTLG